MTQSIRSEPVAIRCRYGELRGLDMGNPSGPLLLCLHGWLDNAASFVRLAPGLSNYRLLALDLPGHGHSDWLGDGGDYSIWSSTEALYDVHEALTGGNQPLIIIGHSMGAAAGMLFAGAFPEKVSAFIALDAVGPLTTTAQLAPQQLADAVVSRRPGRRSRSYATTGEALQARLRQNQELTADCIRPVTERNLVSEGDAVFWRTDPRLRDASKVRLTEEQVQAFIGRIAAPALVVRAADGLIPEAFFHSRLPFFPAVEFRTLPGHHHLHLDAATAPAVAALITEFLEGIG